MDQIITSNRELNIIRYFSLLSIVLILPTLFIHIAIGITLVVILLASLIAFIVIRSTNQNNEDEAVKFALLIGFFLIARVFFTILSKVVLFLFLWFSIVMTVLQEWFFRISYAKYNQVDYLDSSDVSYWDVLCYWSKFFFALIAFIFVLIETKEDVKALAAIKVINIFNIVEQVKSDQNVINLAASNYNSGIKQVRSLGLSLIKYSSYVLLPCTLLQSIVMFFNQE